VAWVREGSGISPHTFDFWVTNRHDLTARVYLVVSGGVGSRIATVAPLSKTRRVIRVPVRSSSTDRIVVTFIADPYFQWDQSLWWVRLGDCVELRIEPLPSATSLMTCEERDR